MHFKGSWKYINKGLLVILGFLVVSTMASIFYLTQTLTGLKQTTQQSGSAVGTVFVLQDLLINLQDIQTGVRGYVLTGTDAYLTPYERASADVPADIKILRSNKDLLLNKSEIDTLEKLANDCMAFSSTTVDIRRNEGFEPAQAMIATGRGEEILRQVRTQITGLSTTSLENLGPMQVKSENNTRRALAVAGATAVLVLGTCVAVIWYFKRAILHERALESTKNEFLSLASHQLRTPATNVKLYLGMLMDGFMGQLNDEQRKALGVAYKNNESEINIMNNLARCREARPGPDTAAQAGSEHHEDRRPGR
jgi:CHASE3 domain sensor protein